MLVGRAGSRPYEDVDDVLGFDRGMGLGGEEQAGVVIDHVQDLRGLPASERRLDGLDDFVLAADLYRTARRAGVTIRKTLDCPIAAPCVRTGAPLLHADTDFDLLAKCTPLRLYS